MCQEIDARVQAFLTRPLEGYWPYLWIDATCVKVRQNGRIVSVAVIVAIGGNDDGRQDPSGFHDYLGLGQAGATTDVLAPPRSGAALAPPFSCILDDDFRPRPAVQ